MCQIAIVCVIFMILFCGQPASTQLQKGTIVISRFSDDSDKSLMRHSEEHISDHKLLTKLSDATNDFPLGRQKRALISFGRLVTNILLQGARLVKSNTFVGQYYIKPGGYKNALDDFDSVNPIKVLQIGPVKTGEVGDKTLMVVPGNGLRPPAMVIAPRNNALLYDGAEISKKLIFYGDYADVMKRLDSNKF